MSKSASATTLALALAALTVGCVGPTRRARVGFGNARNLVFNPGSTGYVVVDTSRSAWPSATAETDPGTDVDIRETIYDYQGRDTLNGNDYIRYVRSTRRGRSRR